MNLTSLLSIWAWSGASDAEQSEDDTVLRESGYSGILCIKGKHETIFCRGLETNEMAGCIVQLHRMTCCDANSSFYGKGNKSVYSQVAKSSVAQNQEAGGARWSLPVDKSSHLGYKKSSAMADARAAKWKTMKNKSFIRLPPYADSLRQHCLRANYLAYLVRHPSLKHHPSPVGHGWELVCGRCPPHATCPPNASACTRASWRGGGRWEQRCWCGRARWLCAENKRAIRI